MTFLRRLTSLVLELEYVAHSAMEIENKQIRKAERVSLTMGLSDPRRARNFKTKEFVNGQDIVAGKTSLHFINAGTQTKVVKN